MSSNPPDRTLSSIVMALAVSGVVVGVFLVAYASLFLPDEVDRGQNPLSVPRRWLQFAFACGVPLAAGFALHATRRAERAETPLSRSLVALAFSAASFAGWVATFFDWSARV